MTKTKQNKIYISSPNNCPETGNSVKDNIGEHNKTSHGARRNVVSETERNFQNFMLTDTRCRQILHGTPEAPTKRRRGDNTC